MINLPASASIFLAVLAFFRRLLGLFFCCVGAGAMSVSEPLVYSSTRHSAKIQIRIEKALISVFKHVIIFTEIFNFRGFLCV